MKKLGMAQGTVLQDMIKKRHRQAANDLGGYGWFGDGSGIWQDDGQHCPQVLRTVNQRVIGFVIRADPKTVVAQCEADLKLVKFLNEFGVDNDLFSVIMEGLNARYPMTDDDAMSLSIGMAIEAD